MDHIEDLDDAADERDESGDEEEEGEVVVANPTLEGGDDEAMALQELQKDGEEEADNSSDAEDEETAPADVSDAEEEGEEQDEEMQHEDEEQDAIVAAGDNGEEGAASGAGYEDGETAAAPTEAEGAEDGPALDPSQIKKPLSAWMHFLAAYREQVRLENPGKKIGERQKLLAAKWAALTETEKATFDAIAAKDKMRFQAELRRAGLTKLPSASSGAAKDAAVHPAHTTTIILPLARVKKAIKLDPEVGNISKEGLNAMAKATELFLAQLAERSWGVARQTGRRGLRHADLNEYVSQAQEMYFLRDELKELMAEQAAEAASGDGGAGKAGRGGGVSSSGGGAAKAGKGGKAAAAAAAAAAGPATGKAAITSFFRKAPAAGTDLAEAAVEEEEPANAKGAAAPALAAATVTDMQVE